MSWEFGRAGSNLWDGLTTAVSTTVTYAASTIIHPTMSALEHLDDWAGTDFIDENHPMAHVVKEKFDTVTTPFTATGGWIVGTAAPFVGNAVSETLQYTGAAIIGGIHDISGAAPYTGDDVSLKNIFRRYGEIEGFASDAKDYTSGLVEYTSNDDSRAAELVKEGLTKTAAYTVGGAGDVVHAIGWGYTLRPLIQGFRNLGYSEDEKVNLLAEESFFSLAEGLKEGWQSDDFVEVDPTSPNAKYEYFWYHGSSVVAETAAIYVVSTATLGLGGAALAALRVGEFGTRTVTQVKNAEMLVEAMKAGERLVNAQKRLEQAQNTGESASKISKYQKQVEKAEKAITKLEDTADKIGKKRAGNSGDEKPSPTEELSSVGKIKNGFNVGAYNGHKFAAPIMKIEIPVNIGATWFIINSDLKKGEKNLEAIERLGEGNSEKLENRRNDIPTPQEIAEQFNNRVTTRETNSGNISEHSSNGHGGAVSNTFNVNTNGTAIPVPDGVIKFTLSSHEAIDDFNASLGTKL